MSVDTILLERSENKCELCAATESLSAYEVQPNSNGSADHFIYVCDTCKGQIENPSSADINHWRCLGDSMWTPVPVVQVSAWRMLTHFANPAGGSDGWARDQLEMLYLDDETMAWAQAGSKNANDDDDGGLIHKDSNGAVLEGGDTVTLIKDLVVKGGGFTAKRGTAVRNISLVQNNAAHIEGKVSGQQIVILTEFVKKSN